MPTSNKDLVRGNRRLAFFLTMVCCATMYTGIHVTAFSLLYSGTDRVPSTLPPILSLKCLTQHWHSTAGRLIILVNVAFVLLAFSAWVWVQRFRTGASRPTGR